MCPFGGYTDEIMLPAFYVRATPRRLTDKEAAAIPVALPPRGSPSWRWRASERGIESSSLELPAAWVPQWSRFAAGRSLGRRPGRKQRQKELVRSLGAVEALTYEEFASRDGAGRHSP